MLTLQTSGSETPETKFNGQSYVKAREATVLNATDEYEKTKLTLSWCIVNVERTGQSSQASVSKKILSSSSLALYMAKEEQKMCKLVYKLLIYQP